jgi:hypothetical protein
LDAPTVRTAAVQRERVAEGMSEHKYYTVQNVPKAGQPASAQVFVILVSLTGLENRFDLV